MDNKELPISLICYTMLDEQSLILTEINLQSDYHRTHNLYSLLYIAYLKSRNKQQRNDSAKQQTYHNGNSHTFPHFPAS